MKKTKNRPSEIDDASVVREASRGRETWVVYAILFVAFLIRTIHLDWKPPHFDEGINGHFVARMWTDGFYKYDPTNFHGPLYFYILQLSELVFGWGMTSYRFVTGLLSVAIVAVVAMHREFIGRAAVWAAALVALSPAFVFYSRYAIHESLFILSQAAFTYGAFLWMRDRSAKAMWWIGLALVGLIATKETFFIFVGTWFIAIFTVEIFEKKWPAVTTRYESAKGASKKPIDAQALVLVSFVTVFVTLALFTGFFMNMKGAGDMISALKVWTKTGTGATGHEKPFIYYTKLLIDYEWPILIALATTPIVFFQVSKPARTLVLIGFGTWVAYGIIPYKTPWLVMSFLWPLAFCFGHLMRGTLAMFRRSLALRYVTFAILLVASAHMIRETIVLNFEKHSDPEEKYVYVQTSNQFKRAIATIEALVKERPETRNMHINVVNKDPWPLPYVMLPYPNNTWGQADTADLSNADVVLADSTDLAIVAAKLRGTYFVLPFKIRDAYQDGQAYFRHELFKSIFPPDAETMTGEVK